MEPIQIYQLLEKSLQTPQYDWYFGDQHKELLKDVSEIVAKMIAAKSLPQPIKVIEGVTNKTLSRRNWSDLKKEGDILLFTNEDPNMSITRFRNNLATCFNKWAKAQQIEGRAKTKVLNATQVEVCYSLSPHRIQDIMGAIERGETVTCYPTASQTLHQLENARRHSWSKYARRHKIKGSLHIQRKPENNSITAKLITNEKK